MMRSAYLDPLLFHAVKSHRKTYHLDTVSIFRTWYHLVHATLLFRTLVDGESKRPKTIVAVRPAPDVVNTKLKQRPARVLSICCIGGETEGIVMARHLFYHKTPWAAPCGEACHPGTAGASRLARQSLPMQKKKKKMSTVKSNGFGACCLSGGSTKFSVQGKVPKVPK